MNKRVNPKPLSKKGKKKKRLSNSIMAAKSVLFTFSVAFCCVVYNIANEQEIDSVEENYVIEYHVIGATDTTETSDPAETPAPAETSVETTSVTEEETLVETEAFAEQILETTTPAEEEILSTCCDISDELPIEDLSEATTDVQIISEESEVTETTFAGYMNEADGQVLWGDSEVNEYIQNPRYCSTEEQIQAQFLNFNMIGVPSNYLEDIPSIFASEINAYDIISELEAAKGMENGKIYDYILKDRSHISLSEHEINIMCNVVWHESGISCLEGQVAVASVILNRLESNDFPQNNIYDIITAPGQFDTAYAANIPTSFEPQGLTYLAVMIALSGYDYSMDAQYFYNPELTKNPETKAWFESLETTQVIGGHTFKK